MTLQLRPAVDAEKRERDVLTYSEWGSSLTLPQYLEREQLLRAHPWAKAGMVTWLLLDDAQLLASCETFRNDSTVGPVPGHSFAVASVFTEPKLRGKGNSVKMISALVERLRLEPQAQSSVLFSDVGAPIYARSGYRETPAFDWVLPPAANQPSVEWLVAPSAPPKVPGAEGQLLLHPSAEQLDWHFERSRIYARFLNRTPLQHFGARTARASAWWSASYKADELWVLCLEANSCEDAQPLLQAAQAQAKHAGLKRVRIWETISLEKFDGARREPREGSLPMYVGLGPPLREWPRVEHASWV